MIRPFLTELALFLAPFVAYAVYLGATRAGVLDPSHWSMSRVAWLLMAALLLMIGSFVVLAQSGARRRLDLCPGAFRGRQGRAGETR